MKNEDPVNTYIVRIYRLAGNKPRAILGTAEKVGKEEKKAFTCFDELWRILNPHQVRQPPSEQNKEPRGRKKRKPP